MVNTFKDNILFVLASTIMVLSVTERGQGEILSCVNKQYANVNEEGILNCEITESFYGVYWYVGNSKDSIIRFINRQKAGPEYQSGRLDIADNGSMIINNVRLSDEKQYRVMVVLSAGGDVTAMVHLIVVVRSALPHPIVDGCNTDQLPCVLCADSTMTLACRMDGKPPVELAWYDAESDVPFENQTRSTNDASSNTISSSTTIVKSPLTSEKHEILLICRASGKAVTPNTKNASVLVVKPSELCNVKNTIYFVVNETITLETDIELNTNKTVTWIKQTSFHGDLSNQCLCEYVNNSLGHSKINLEKLSTFDEGIYTSFAWNNGTYQRYPISVSRAELPATPNITVNQNGDQGSLSLIVKSRPTVNIEWDVGANANVTISSVSSNGVCESYMCSTFMTIKYTIHGFSCTEMDFKISGSWFDSFSVQKRICDFRGNSTSTENPITTGPSRGYTYTQHVSAVHETTESPPSCEENGSQRTIVGIMCLVVFLILVVIVVLLCKRRTRGRRLTQNQTNATDDIPLQKEKSEGTQHPMLRKDCN